MAQFHDPRVATRTRGKPFADFGEQLGRDGLVLEPPLHQPARVQIAAPRERNEPLGERTQLFRLRLGGLDAAVHEEARRHVVQRRLLVARRARQLPALGAVAHYSSSVPVSCARGALPGSTIRMSPPGISSSCIPKFRPSRRSSSAISPSAFSPTFLTFRRSSSLYRTRSPSVRMFEFFSEFTDRTDSPASSMARPSTSRSRAPSVPPLPCGSPATTGTLPKSTKKRKCSWASAAAYATASSGEIVPFVSTVSVSRS